MARRQSSTRMERRSARVGRRRRWTGLAVVCLVIAVLGGVWWQDQPLRRMSALLDASDFDQTIRTADRFLTHHPGDTRAQMLKARALSGLNRHVAADMLFRKVALECNGFPDDPAALRAWSVSLLSLQKWPRAVAVLETLHQSFPADPQVLYRLTVARIRLRHYAAALESAEQLALVKGHAEEALVMIGTIHHDRGNHRAALEAWDRILQNNPDANGLQISADEFLAMVGEVLLEVGYPERAVRTLEQSIRIHSDADALALLGKAYSQTSQPEDAEHAWQEALRRDDTNLTAREELSNLALRNGEPQQAIDLMQPVIAASDMTSSSAYLLQRAHAQLNDERQTEFWKDRTNELRENEKVRSTISELIRNTSDSYWSGCLHAYDLALRHHWIDAQSLVSDLLLQHPDEPFLQRLATSIEHRGPLPPLDELSNEQF